MAVLILMRSFLGRSAVVALTLAVWFVSAAKPACSAPARIKELVEVQGVRDNMLYGYGLVVGLPQTGDSERVFFTSQSISGMLGRLGIRIDPKDVRTRNVAAVMVTAKLPTYTRTGARITVQVGSMGNAMSLAGGVLLVTPLTGPDGQVYALAQGPVQVGGFNISAAGSRIQKNAPTSGSIPGGAIVERSVTPALGDTLVLSLQQPDFTTASRIAEIINTTLGAGAAKPLDPASVEIKVPEAMKGNPIAVLTQIEALEVDADQRARVVISERTGTVVAGDRVRIRPVAIAHGGLSIAVSQTPFVSQPGAFSPNGRTVAGRVASVEAKEKVAPMVSLPATASVDDLVKALNTLGVTPLDLVSIFQALKAQGALDADLEVL